jgi:mevalonate kinase
MNLSLPGKVFLLGEYAVTQGSAAWVATLEPRFQLQVRASDHWEIPFAAASPAGKWLEQVRAVGETTPQRLEFFDPHQGRGGFGASTAEFALAYAASVPTVSVWECWKKYRELTRTEQGILPSGADLVAQLCGGIQRVRISRPVLGQSELTFTDISAHLLRYTFVVFSATGLPDRKIQTHKHLETIPWGSQGLRDLEQHLADAELALRDGDVTALGKSMSRYAEVLCSLGLEHPQATEERRELSQVPGVLGYKGCGAGLSDTAVALVANAAAADRLIEAALKRGLTLVTRELSRTSGLELAQ